jgi:hypothetical protein
MQLEAGVTDSSTNKEWFPKTRSEQQKVKAQLELILASPHFRQSKRSQALFRYIVMKTMEGQVSILKERTLGVEVFGRAPDYDTNADPIVRMTAGEIRKRIAQYYHDSANSDELGIDLPSGSYTAQFHLPTSAGEPHEAVAEAPLGHLPQGVSPGQTTEQNRQDGLARSSRARWIGLSVGVAFLLLLVGYFAYLRLHRSSTEVAWGDVLDERSTTLIVVGRNSLNYNPYSTPNSTLDSNSISASHHMGADTLSFSEARALVRLVRILDGQKTQYNILSASTTTFADLRQGPAILLGGLNNPWTMRAQQQLRYRLATDNNGLDWISDARDPGSRKFAVDVKLPYSSLNIDYAIVARFFDSTTQKPTLVVAGLAEDGTKAASEFITDEKQLRDALGSALQGSKAKNFEVVLGTQVINGVSGPPKILAREVW